jgi:hypothetical protein
MVYINGQALKQKFDVVRCDGWRLQMELGRI